MKKIFTAFSILFAFASTASANGYCDGLSGQAHVEKCYLDNIDMRAKLLVNEFNQLVQTGVYSDEQIRSMADSQKKFADSIDAQCKSLQCVEQSMINRTIALHNEYLRVTKK